MTLASRSFQRRCACFAAALLILSCFSGCTTTSPRDTGSSAAQRSEIDAGVNATFPRLYQSVPASRQLVERAAGVLVFPSVLAVSLGVGVEHGDGALRVSGKTAGYYATTSGSIGLQAGAQSQAIVLLFMTPESLAKFRNSNGWTVGADATVAIANVGANGGIDTITAQAPVIGFVLTNSGVMAGVSLEGTKVSRINP
jgi:lipid-binding SYLF domain-containing protein